MASLRGRVSRCTTSNVQRAILVSVYVCLHLVLSAANVAPRDFGAGAESRIPSRYAGNARFPYADPTLSVADRIQAMLRKDMRKADSIRARIATVTSDHHQPERRVLDSDSISIPLTMEDPNFYEYLTPFQVGSPPNDFVGVADTGSDLVWVQCDPCTECMPNQPVFDTGNSTTFSNLNCSDPYCLHLNYTGAVAICSTAGVCSYEYTYGTGRTSGDLSTDYLGLVPQSGYTSVFPNFVFGCAHASGDGLKTPILALSRGPLSLVGQLAESVGSAFSMCFAPYFNNQTTSIELGSKGTDDLDFTPLVANPPGLYYYYANLTGISVNGLRLLLPPRVFSINPQSGSGGFILDTGSSFTTLVDEAYYPLRLALEAYIKYPTGSGRSKSFDLCYDVTGANPTMVEDLGLPNITLHFDNLDLDLPIDNTYFVFRDNEVLTACLAITPGGNGISIFGNYQMQNYYFLFDPASNRVGVKPQIC